MRRAYITAVAAAALLATGAPPAAHAAPGTAPFGCDARAGVTCFFKLFLGPRATRMVQLQSGMKVSIPGVDIGNDRYCVSASKPPVPKCAQTIINATYNH
jgi:hypothetical protein